MKGHAAPRPRTFQAQFGRSVSLDQACAILGVSRRTVYNWIRDGRLETIRTLLGSQRVLIDSLRRLAPDQVVTSGEAARLSSALPS
jgi:excisionase family DNA binding protein